MKISFAEPDLPHSGAAVAGIWEERNLTPAARRLDEASGGAITRALAQAARFSGKKGELLPIVAPANLTAEPNRANRPRQTRAGRRQGL